MSKATSPKLDQVQAAFLAAIEKDGLGHVFEWMHGWFDKVAEAAVEDELAATLGEHAKDPQARSLRAMDLMMQLAASISNHSTSASSNLMRQARLAALAQIVENDYGCDPTPSYGSRAQRGEQWERWRAARSAAQATQEEAARTAELSELTSVLTARSGSR